MGLVSCCAGPVVDWFLERHAGSPHPRYSCPQAAKEMATFHINVAACQLKLQQWKGAVKSCSSAIEIKPDLAKA